MTIENRRRIALACLIVVVLVALDACCTDFKIYPPHSILTKIFIEIVGFLALAVFLWQIVKIQLDPGLAEWKLQRRIIPLSRKTRFYSAATDGLVILGVLIILHTVGFALIPIFKAGGFSRQLPDKFTVLGILGLLEVFVGMAVLRFADRVHEKYKAARILDQQNASQKTESSNSAALNPPKSRKPKPIEQPSQTTALSKLIIEPPTKPERRPGVVYEYERETHQRERITKREE